MEHIGLHDKKNRAGADLLMEETVVVGFQWLIVQ